tara:strand:- start:854 stop:1738 length:885 start_codon:yes stop_codon:yes gene_type:complete
LKENSRVLIIGASGRVGREVFKIFKNSSNYDIFGTFNKNKFSGLENLDITDLEQVEKLFEKIKPTILIHSAGMIYPGECEKNKELAWKINVTGTKNLLKFCLKYNCKFVYISTDYVFDGSSNSYIESDETNPLNVYGKTKFESEKLVSSIPEHLIIRTAWVNDVENDSKCFVMQVINSLKNHKEFVVHSKQSGNPTLASNLANIVVELVLNNLKGIYHVTGLTHIDRLSFAKKIAEKFSLDSNLIILNSDKKSNDSVIRPHQVKLNLDKLKSVTKLKILTLEEQLEIMKQKFKQ